METYKVLFIDDSIDNLKTMIAVFSKHLPHYKTYQTNNSRKAVTIAQQVIPDLIVTDWDMPKLNGLDVVRALKSNKFTKEIPVIMATGVMLTTEHLQMALNAGAVDYIRKPIDPTELIARTKSALLLANYYKEIVRQKDHELTENAMHLIKNSEYINAFANSIEEIEEKIISNPERAKQELAELKDEAKQHNKHETWRRFNISFSKVHGNFQKNILEAYPTLTPAEIKLCALIKLGMSNKEIASVLFQSPDSIKVSRYRMRKKFSVDKSVNIENFLAQF